MYLEIRIEIIMGSDEVDRGNWSGKLDFLLSCIGYAVGKYRVSKQVLHGVLRNIPKLDKVRLGFRRFSECITNFDKIFEVSEQLLIFVLRIPGCEFCFLKAKLNFLNSSKKVGYMK